MTSEEITALYQSVFSTEQGKRCLEHLKGVFVDRDIYQPGATLDRVSFRQGESSIIKKIIKEVG